MNKQCPRCEGKKVYKKECCVKCGGKGYITKIDREIVKNIKNIYNAVAKRKPRALASG